MKKNLGFSLQPDTTMIVARATETTPWNIEAVVARDDGLTIHPNAAALHYGRSIFEGMKAFRTFDDRIVLFRPSQNARRMHNGAEAFGLIPVPEQFFLEAVKMAVQENDHLIPDAGEGSLYIRPLLMDARGVMGLTSSGSTDLLVMVNPVGEYFSGGLTGVWLYHRSDWTRTAPGMGGNIKTGCNYGLGIPRKYVAQQRSCAEVLYTRYGTTYVDECGAMNLFFVKDRVLYTPSLEHGTVLPGITRKSVIQLARARGYSVVESDDIPIDFVADECFGTGTAAAIAPVLGWRGPDGREHCFSNEVGPVTRSLHGALTGLQTGLLTDEFGWLHTVEV